MSSDKISIRPAAPEDMEKLWPLVQDFAFSSQPERSAFTRTFSDLLERSDTIVLVAVANMSAIVGYLLGSYHGTFFANGPVAWIEELMVGESSRHQGVATRLMSAAEEWARSVSTPYIALASRRAGDFYLGIGYDGSATYFRKTLGPPRR